MSQQNSPLERFAFRRLTLENKAGLESLLKLYLEEEPMTRHFDLTEEDKEIYIQTHLDLAFVHGISFGCFEINNGEPIGFGIATFPSHHMSSGDFTKFGKNISANFQKLLRFHNYLMTLAKSIPGSENAMILKNGIVKQKYRHLNLYQIYLDRAKEVAVHLKCDAIVTFGVNKFTNNYDKRYGYVKIKDVYYKDYRDPVTGEAVLAGIPPPHTRAAVLMMPITAKSNI